MDLALAVLEPPTRRLPVDHRAFRVRIPFMTRRLRERALQRQEVRPALSPERQGLLFSEHRVLLKFPSGLYAPEKGEVAASAAGGGARHHEVPDLSCRGVREVREQAGEDLRLLEIGRVARALDLVDLGIAAR